MTEISTDDTGLIEMPQVKLTKAEKKAKYRLDYPEPIKSRREMFKIEYQKEADDRDGRIRDLSLKYFDEDFKNGTNIYGSLIEHFKAMPDRTKNNEHNLTSIYLRSFKTWLEDQNEKELQEKYLTRDIQVAAIHSCNGVPHYSEIIHSLFNLADADLNDVLISDIEEKLSKREFKEAAENAIMNKLKHHFSFKKIVLPLILQDKHMIAYEYMRGMPEYQREFVKWHDDLVGKSELIIEDELNAYTGIMTVSSLKFVGKSLEKYMNSIFNKIAKDYDFDVSCSRDAPRFESKKHEKALKHLISSRFDIDAKNKASDDVYFQHVRSTLEQCKPDDVELFLHFLWTSNNEEKRIDALSWIRLRNYDVHSREVPGKIRDELRTGKAGRLMALAEESLKKRISLEMPENGRQLFLFPESETNPITIIKNDSGLNQLCADLRFFEADSEIEEKFIGIDTEWKPSHLTQSTNMKIAIMQIYFGDRVYIVDCIELEKDPTIRDKTWQTFAKQLLCCEKFKVVGFDLKLDLDAFLSIKALKDEIQVENIKKVYCLKRLTENICEVDMSVLGLVRKSFKLADLTEKFLDIKLNKTEQCSNWQSRPLRREQIVYAAMDSYVVVKIYLKIFEILKKSNSEIDQEKIFEESNVMAPKKETTKKENKKIEVLKWIEIYDVLKEYRDESKPLKRPYEIYCIVDTMLLGFGKYLRRCGINVLIPHDVRDFHNKLKALKRGSKDQMRYILTVPSKSYDSLRVEYPDHTIPLPEITTKSALDQLKMFFEQFNIDIRPDDVFLRCVDCNSRHLARFPSPVVHFLHQYLIIYLQNVYRSDMSEFPIEEYYQKMKEINPEDFEGINVKMSRPKSNSDWIVATTSEANLHITRNVLIHKNCCEGVEVRINKVPDDAFKRPNLVFYLCGDCGKVNYDGRIVNNNGNNSKSNTSSASTSEESVTQNNLKA